MLWLFGTIYVDNRASVKSSKIALVQSLVLLFLLALLALIICNAYRLSWVQAHLLYDTTSALVGAQAAVVVYHVVVLREQLK